jgi:hypothetical protein
MRHPFLFIRGMHSMTCVSRLWKNSLPHVTDDVPGAEHPRKPEVFLPGKSLGGLFPRPVSGILALSMLLGIASAVAWAEDDRVIQLAIQADPGMSAFEVENKFTVARDSTKGFNYGEISVDPIDPASYVLLSSIVRRGILQAAPVTEAPRGVLVEPIRGQDGDWWIDLRDPDMFLDSARITVVDATSGKERLLELEPAARTEAARPLRYHSPGSYVLALEKGVHPRAAILTVSTESSAGGSPRTEELRVAWPDVGRCYLVTLRGVTGDERRLFESLKDPAKVGNAIKELYPSTATLIVGSFQDKKVDVWRLNEVLHSYLQPVNAKPKRLWLRFPLTDTEEATVIADLEAQLAPADGFKKLPAWLAARRLPAGRSLEPGMESWVEVPVNPATERAEVWVPIVTAAWKRLLDESPAKVGDRAILVWEFENPANPADREVIKVAGERYQRERLGWWLTGLAAAPVE